MQVVPVQAVPSQTLTVTLGNQACTLNIYTKSHPPNGLYMDVLVNNVLIAGGIICQNLNVIVRYAYLGFIGDLCWFDRQPTAQTDPYNEGPSDPVYTGIGTRYVLLYLAPDDLPPGVS